MMYQVVNKLVVDMMLLDPTSSGRAGALPCVLSTSKDREKREREMRMKHAWITYALLKWRNPLLQDTNSSLFNFIDPTLASLRMTFVKEEKKIEQQRA